MSVKVRPYRRGGWEVDITIRLPDGSRWRERSKAPVSSKSAAVRSAEDRERHVLQHGMPEPKKEVPTLEQFAPRFVDGHARANRQKPSGIASKEAILQKHLIPMLGSKPLDAITTEHVQNVKRQLKDRAPKTVNNVLTVLNTLLKKAVEWDVIERTKCTIRLLPVPKTSVQFHDFDQYERLVEIARRHGSTAHLDRSAGWRGRVAMRRDCRARVGGRRLAETPALCAAIRLEGSCDDPERRSIAVRAAHDSSCRGASGPPTPPITARALSAGWGIRDAEDRFGSCAPRRAGGESPEQRCSRTPSHLLFAPGDAWRAGAGYPGARRTSRSVDDATVHAPESGSARRGRAAVGRCPRSFNPWRHSGDGRGCDRGRLIVSAG